MDSPTRRRPIDGLIDRTPRVNEPTGLDREAIAITDEGGGAPPDIQESSLEGPGFFYDDGQLVVTDEGGGSPPDIEEPTRLHTVNRNLLTQVETQLAREARARRMRRQGLEGWGHPESGIARILTPVPTPTVPAETIGDIGISLGLG